jgi:hypothetical protein
MTIGIAAFRDPGELRLDRMLTQPFREDASAASDARDAFQAASRQVLGRRPPVPDDPA